LHNNKVEDPRAYLNEVLICSRSSYLGVIKGIACRQFCEVLHVNPIGTAAAKVDGTLHKA